LFLAKSITPEGRVLLEEAMSPMLVYKFNAFDATGFGHFLAHNVLPIVSILKQNNPTQKQK
jgi:hypothetical protein